MPTPPLSDTTTHDIRVGATAYYLPEESTPEDDQYVFGYRILIVNQGSEPARLLSRQWTIIDAEGQQRLIKGPGVVGQHPRLEAGQAFKYSSFCPLNTPWGTMEGQYLMQRDDGSEFHIDIGRFYLASNKLDTAEPDDRLFTNDQHQLNP
jgi:ApaG protein